MTTYVAALSFAAGSAEEYYGGQAGPTGRISTLRFAYAGVPGPGPKYLPVMSPGGSRSVAAAPAAPIGTTTVRMPRAASIGGVEWSAGYLASRSATY